MTPIMWGLLIAFIIATLITAYLTFLTVREVFGANKSEEGNPQLALKTSQVEIPASLSGPLQSEGGPSPQPWDGANRVNILLMGLDLRDWEGEGPSRTDTMLLFTFDPVSHSAGMLSIPRDLWVNIPGFEYGKINTAYYLGDAYDVPGGGPGLAIETVEELLGIPINYYAQIDFGAFERLVDEIGGIEINIPEEITVDPLGPHNTVTLEPGPQILDGPTSLAYARNRDTFGGDFDRAERTQQVILAVKNRILNLDMLSTLISKAPILYKELASGVHTNMTLEEAIKIAWLIQQIPPENIQRAVIGVEQVTMTMSADGLDILQPDPDAIRLLRDEIFTNSGPISPVATATIVNPTELMRAENASVSVLNATRTAGLAAETTEFLLSKDINVTLTSNAQEESANTVIIDYTGNPYTIQYLVNLMDIQASEIYSRYDPNSETDIAILLGEDWAFENPMP